MKLGDQVHRRGGGVTYLRVARRGRSGPHTGTDKPDGDNVGKEIVRRPRTALRFSVRKVALHQGTGSRAEYFRTDMGHERWKLPV